MNKNKEREEKKKRRMRGDEPVLEARELRYGSKPDVGIYLETDNATIMPVNKPRKKPQAKK